MEVNEINPDWLLREIAKLNSKVHAPIQQMHLDGMKKEILQILDMRMRTVEEVEDKFKGIYSRLNEAIRIQNRLVNANNNLVAKLTKLEDKMTKLTTKARKALPKKDFALPKEEKYPVEDKAHARNAKARASQQVKKGNLSEANKEKIDRKADKVLKKGKKK